MSQGYCIIANYTLKMYRVVKICPFNTMAQTTVISFLLKSFNPNGKITQYPMFIHYGIYTLPQEINITSINNT
jgi:hypothetical protein